MAFNKNQPRIPKGFVGAGRFMTVGQALIAIAKDASHPGGGGRSKHGKPKLAKAGAKLTPSVKPTAPKAPTSKNPSQPSIERGQRIRAVADTAARIEELVDADNDIAEIRASTRAAAARQKGQGGEAELQKLADAIDGVDNPQTARLLARQFAEGHGLTRVGDAGGHAVFDRRTMKAVDSGIEPGDRVFVVSPGYTIQSDDDISHHIYGGKSGEPVTVPVRKALVEEGMTPDEEARYNAERSTPAPVTSVWTGVPDWADDPDVNAAVADSKAHRQDMATRLKAGVKPGEVTGQRALAAVPSGLHTAGALTRMTKDQRDFLRQYRGTAFPNINGALRRERGDLPGHFGFEFHREAVGHLDAVMERSKLQADVVVHRGVMDGREIFGSAWDRDMTGAEWTEHAYVSTSADPNVVLDERFFKPDGGAVLRIRAPKGTGAAALSDGTYESEILLQRGLKMKVLSDTGPGPDRVIEVGIVHDRPRRPAAARRPGSSAASDGAAGDGVPGRGGLPGRGTTGSRPVAAPAAPRLAKAGGRLTVSPAEVATQLRTATSREQAQQLIAGLSVAQLRQLAAQTGVSVRSSDNKAALRNTIVALLVGRRLDSFAIYPG